MRIAPPRFLLLGLVLALSTEARAQDSGAGREAVRIASEPGVVLAGELRLPAAARVGRVPVVLLLGGGGPSPHGIYPDLEQRLLAAGIATLSYDKRGIGASTGSFLDTMALMRRDAVAALAWLHERREIDHRRIAILGLSQGGVLAQELAASDPGVAAVVMLAAPAGQRGQLFLDEMRVKLTASGMSAAAVEPIVEATRAYMDALTAPAPSDATAAARDRLVAAFGAAGWSGEQAEGAVGTLSNPATVPLYTVAASDTLAQLRVPVLALYAGEDTVVATARNVPEARRALARNRDATVIEVPHVNHGFQQQVPGAGAPDYKGWPLSDPETLRLLERWIVPRLTGAAAPAR